MTLFLGVLLRMFFVLFVLLVRARRANTTPSPPTGPIHLVADEIIFVAPPEYIEDEKAPLYSPSPDAVELIVEEKEEVAPAPAATA